MKWPTDKYCKCEIKPEGCSHCRRCDGWNSRGKADRHAVEEALSVEKLDSLFNQYPNYDDELPDELFEIFKTAVQNNDKDLLTETMRICVRKTRKECREAIRKQIMDELFGGEDEAN